MAIGRTSKFTFIFVLAVGQLSLGAAVIPFCRPELENLARPAKQALTPDQNLQIQKYLSDTISSLEKMRGANGLVSDTIEIQPKANGEFSIKTLNINTSPTNIAVDLLVQSEISSHPEYHDRAYKNLSRALSTLTQLDYHTPSGLFYSRYSADSDSIIRDRSVSSIDNLHLAIALFTIKENFDGSLLAMQAKKLLKRMNFSVYYDEASHLVGGNLRYDNGRWIREEYNFSNVGSEARLLYTTGWALGLYGIKNNGMDFPQNTIPELTAEILKSKVSDLLRVWDSSEFQVFFPKMFTNEEIYSRTLDNSYRARANFVLAEGRRRRLPLPAGHSPGSSIIEVNDSETTYGYNDKAGIPSTASSGNRDFLDPRVRRNSDSVVTPYALFMAATSDPSKFIPKFSRIENLSSGSNRLYVPTMGWMDGYYVKGPYKGQVIPTQLSLNQGMIALSLFQILASDGLSLSSRSLYNNPRVRRRLQFSYDLLDAKLQSAGVSE